MVKSLLELWQAGVDAVRGDTCVATHVRGLGPMPPTCILSVGKAAVDMARPAMRAFPDAETVIVTKHGHMGALPRPAEVIEAGHPVPDAASLRGGAALAQAVAQCGADAHVLMLVSGGASAVVELLPGGGTLADWQAQTEKMIASGADIHQINAFRRAGSRIKGGKLLGGFGGAQVTTLAISDVQGDDLMVIGSGIGAAPQGAAYKFSHKIVASNAIARAAMQAAAEEGILANEECLYDDITALAPRLGARVREAGAGLSIFGGEPTVILPANPGRGGRNQALGLLMAEQIAGIKGIEVLVAGTDGTDGPTEDAGALVDGTTWGDGAQDALARADAGSYLAARDALVRTGPTGTNVMDLMLVRMA